MVWEINLDIKIYRISFNNKNYLFTIFLELLLQADGEDESPLCRKYREELDQLKDEFERYRLRAQSVLKNKKVHPDHTSFNINIHLKLEE